MVAPESSLGARLNEVERKIAVHEAVCEERQKATMEGIAQIRIELAARGQKMESLVRAWSIVIAAAVAGFEFYRRAGGIGLP